MLQAIDRWVGKTLFVPLIVRFCQRTKMTQYAVSAYVSFASALWMLYAGDALWIKVVFGAFALFHCIYAALLADHPLSPASWGWRVIYMATLLLDCAEGRWAWVVFWVLVLVANYALTIHTIPPLETKERKPSGKLAPARRST